MAQTLEEVAQNIFGLVDPILGKSNYRRGYERGLIKGAEWMEKQMYSEEDILEAMEWARTFSSKMKDVDFIKLFKKQ